jgi:methionine synthase II (cobalamin-independent)
MSPKPALNPPFRAEHIGSLLRPEPLHEKRKLFGANKCTAEELGDVEDEAVKHVVKLQQDLGLKTITDGEQRRCTIFAE